MLCVLCVQQGSGERPVKDSAQSMHSARSSDKSGMRTSGSGSTTVRSMLDTLYSSRGGITGQACSLLPLLSLSSLLATFWWNCVLSSGYSVASESMAAPCLGEPATPLADCNRVLPDTSHESCILCKG